MKFVYQILEQDKKARRKQRHMRNGSGAHLTRDAGVPDCNKTVEHDTDHVDWPEA